MDLLSPNMTDTKKDLIVIRQNLRDLDTILGRIENEFKHKNQILDKGLKEAEVMRVNN
jgi:hypothetical protein